eukprot:m.175390 g.175390  ORF g.175390 m.175390 type:complete len:120 (+) comp18350_c0_seq19:1620-1979(+)
MCVCVLSVGTNLCSPSVCVSVGAWVRVWLCTCASCATLGPRVMQVMGMYFVSLVIMMRMNMPERYRAKLVDVLGDLEFSYYHHWFDRIFLVSALSCVMTIYFSRIKAPEGVPPTADRMR